MISANRIPQNTFKTLRLLTLLTPAVWALMRKAHAVHTQP